MKGKTIKTFKTLLLTIAAATFCLALAFSMPKMSVNFSAFADDENTATIETVDGFVMNYGADIRVDGDEGGIRYTTNVSASAYSAIAAKVTNYKSLNFYTLLGRVDKGITFDGLTMESAATSNYVVKTKTSKTINGDQDDNYMATYITNNSANYGKELIARGVAEIIDQDDKATYVYATASQGETDNKRSMSGLAVSAIQDTEAVTQDSGLKKYFVAQSATSETYAETKAEASTLSLNVPTMADGESVKAAFIDGNRLDVALNDGVTVNQVSNVTAENYGDSKTVTLYTDKNNAYNVTVKKISKVINNETEFLKLYDYLDVTNDTTNYILTMDGYVVLGANLDFSSFTNYYNCLYAPEAGNRAGFGWISYCNEVKALNGTSGITSDKASALKYKTAADGVGSGSSLTDSGKKIAESNGFVGTFDGQGYTIKGLRIAAMGLFPTVGKTGIIKNVAFADTTLCCNCFTFGSLFAGTLDNVLIDISKVAEPYTDSNGAEQKSWGFGGISNYFMGTAKNSLIYMLDVNESEITFSMCGAVAYYPITGQDIWSGLYLFANGEKIKFYGNLTNSNSYNGNSTNRKIMFSDVSSFASDTNKDSQIAKYNKDIWDFETYDVPVFKTYSGTHIAAKTAEAE